MKRKNQKLVLKLLNLGWLISEPKTGEIYTRRHPNKKELLETPRRIRGGVVGGGYLQCVLCYKKKEWHIRHHQIIWISVYGEIPKGLEIDHKNEDKLDNRISNLQLFTRSQQMKKARRRK